MISNSPNSTIALTTVISDAAFEADLDGRVLHSNSAFVQLLRLVPGDDWRSSVHERDRTLVDSIWNQTLSDPTGAPLEVDFNARGGGVSLRVRIHAVVDDEGTVAGAVGIVVPSAVTRPPSWDSDPVTGLPERGAAMADIAQLVDHGTGVVAYVKLDQPTEIVRKEAARRLLATLRPDDVVAVAGDDGFLLSMHNVAQLAAAEQIGTRLTAALSDATISVRVGLALCDVDVAAATLVREAEAGAWSADTGEWAFAD